MKRSALVVSGIFVAIVVLFFIFQLETSNSKVNEYLKNNLSTREITEQLENDITNDMGIEAAALPEGIVLDDGKTKKTLKDKKNYYYTSIAPYINETHECYNHNLITCRGELVNKMMNVTVVDDNGKEILNINKKTANNGFLGFWLPRDIKGTLKVKYNNKVTTRAIKTTLDSQTCLTDLRLM